MTRTLSLNAGRLLLAASLASLLMTAACSTNGLESITVGSIPDDYRTNHPIVIGERDRKLDLPVGKADHRMTHFHKSALAGFMDRYDAKAAAPVTVIMPRGSVNEIAAANVAGDVMRALTYHGVPRHRIAIAAYQANPDEMNAPIRIIYSEMRASTGPCGRWPEDLGQHTENKHYANFGCSYQNNMAAQIANPADLLTPRKQTTIDAENRDVAITRYKTGAVAEEFAGNSEVGYDN